MGSTLHGWGKTTAPIVHKSARAANRAQFAATDRRIDELVYELYGLTDKEVAIVEGQALAAPDEEGAAEA